MSILDTGPHTVVVVPKVKGAADGYGGFTLVDGDPVTVSGLLVEPHNEDMLRALGGEQAYDEMLVIGRGPWPGGVKSTVVWNGEEYDQIGEARQYTNGRRTKHFDVRILARRAEVK